MYQIIQNSSTRGDAYERSYGTSQVTSSGQGVRYSGSFARDYTLGWHARSFTHVCHSVTDNQLVPTQFMLRVETRRGNYSRNKCCDPLGPGRLLTLASPPRRPLVLKTRPWNCMMSPVASPLLSPKDTSFKKQKRRQCPCPSVSSSARTSPFSTTGLSIVAPNGPELPTLLNSNTQQTSSSQQTRRICP